MLEHKIENHVFNIRPDNSQRNKFYCVMQNPFKSVYETKVIFGGSPEIVARKINKYYEKLKGEINNV